MNDIFRLRLAAMAIVALAVCFTVQPAMAGEKAVVGAVLRADLSGDMEVPGPGDAAAGGSAELAIKPAWGEISFKLNLSNLDDPAAAHIHIGAAGVAGPVVVDFYIGTLGLEGVLTGLDPMFLEAIIMAPEFYYVNVHTAAYPDGAIRGQLAFKEDIEKDIEEPEIAEMEDVELEGSSDFELEDLKDFDLDDLEDFDLDDLRDFKRED